MPKITLNTVSRLDLLYRPISKNLGKSREAVDAKVHVYSQKVHKNVKKNHDDMQDRKVIKTLITALKKT